MMGLLRPHPSVLAVVAVALAASSGLTASCGGGAESTGGGAHDAGTVDDAGAPRLVVVPGAPAKPAQEPAGEAHDVDGYAAAMAGNGALIAVGTTTAVYRIDAAGPVQLALVGDEPDLPASTGEVRAMAAYADGLLIAAENGLFFTDGAAVQLSLASATLGPLGITAMSARVTAADDGGAPAVHLAFLAGGAAHELEDGALITWTVSGESGAATAVFAQQDRVFVSYGHRSYEIDRATKKAFALPDGLGAIHAIACGSLACDEGSLLYFAGSAGLVERAADGAYRRYPLAAEGAPAVPVETFALDAQKQRLYALAGTAVLRVRAGEIPDAVATLAAPALPRRMVIDKSGDAWVGEGLSVRRLSLGTPLSFATDVRPILHEYCADCHATASQGAPKRDFESYDVAVDRIATILMRVQDGSMPPVSFGKKLPKESIQILQDWAVTKAP
jgi:hypothetical protein